MKQLILVRHGETVDNVAQIIQGQTHGRLSPRGIRQAELLGERLKGHPIDVILSSDLQRAKDTVLAISRHHPCPVVFTTEVRERSFGIYEGRLREEYLDVIHKLGINQSEFLPEGGESPQHVMIRSKGFFDSTMVKHRGKTVLVCAHGAFNRSLILSLLGYSIERYQDIDQKNACLNIFNFTDAGVLESHSINDISHLSSLDLNQGDVALASNE